jgi:hypothetical protein
MMTHDGEESEFVRHSFNLSHRIRSEGEPPVYIAVLHVDSKSQSITGQIFEFMEFLASLC